MTHPVLSEPTRQLVIRMPIVAWLLLFSLPSLVVAQDWPALRGSDGRGNATLSERLTKGTSLELKTRWKKELGSGYSSLVVADGRLFAMYSNGEDDVLECFATADGETLWQISLGETYKGMNGSFDGPIATPLVFEGVVYALNARGKFTAFKAADGETLWQLDLVEQHDAVTPLYGFATSPLESNGVLILQHGARDSAVMGIDPKNGDVIWKAASGAINSQSPTELDFAGETLVACCCGNRVFGLNPKNGEVRFDFSHEGTNGSAMVPVLIGDDTLVLTNDDSFSEAYQLTVEGDSIKAEQKWKQRSIKNTYNIPAVAGPGLFAFSTRILTCVDPETGRANWKSREPGDGFLVVADPWLIVSTKEGGLHLARADREAYREISKVKPFDDLVWSVPAVSEDAVFIRSLSEIARVDILETNAIANTAETAEFPVASTFEELLQTVSQKQMPEAKLSLLEEFLSNQQSFPVIDEGIAHFIYQGPGRDVALACDAFGARQEQPMKRIDGTNFFYYGMKLPEQQRLNYVFLVDYKPTLDTRNPRSMTSTVYAGEMEFAVRLRNDEPLKMSWFGMSEFNEPAYLATDTTELQGELVTDQIASEGGSGDYPVSIYLPPSYEDQTERNYPLVIVFDSANAKKRGGLPLATDRLFETKQAPEAILLFLDGGPGQDPQEFANFLADKLLPSLSKKYRVSDDRLEHVCWGTNFMAGYAMASVITRPDVFGAAAIQSPLVFDSAREQAIAGLQAVEQPVKVYLEWGRYDMFNPVENWDVRQMSEEIVKRASTNSQVEFSGGQVDDTTDWSSWRNRYDRLLNSLLLDEK